MSQQTVNQINMLRNQGFDDSQIILTLQEQGLPPREINDSLAQSKIKAAVSDYPQPPSPYNNDGQYPQSQNLENSGEEYGSMYQMQPSIIDQQHAPGQPQETLPPQNPQDYSQQYPQEQSPQYPPQSQYSQENNQSPDYSQNYPYPQENQQESYYGLNTETMSEIVEQLIQEKLIITNNAVAVLAEFKVLIEGKVDKIDQRLERIEKIIDQLQTSIIRKSSESSQDVEDIKTEMKMMQQGFSKMVNPLTDRSREMENHHKSKKSSSPHKISKAKKHKKISK
ncbi:MAG: hypothetical protein AABX03_03880 [Nanoarchaeota archaeon]